MAFSFGIAAGAAVDSYKATKQYLYEQQQREAQEAATTAIQNLPKVNSQVVGGVGQQTAEQALTGLKINAQQVNQLVTKYGNDPAALKAAAAKIDPAANSLIFGTGTGGVPIAGPARNAVTYTSIRQQQDAADIMINSGSPQLMQQGTQMKTAAIQQQMDTIQLQQAKLTQDFKIGQIKIAEGDVNGGLQKINQGVTDEMQSDPSTSKWSSSYTANKDGTYNFQIKAGDGTVVSAHPNLPLSTPPGAPPGSGSVMDMVMQMQDPSQFAQLQISREGVANDAIRAHAAVTEAGAAVMQARNSGVEAQAAMMGAESLGAQRAALTDALKVSTDGTKTQQAQATTLAQAFTATKDPLQKQQIANQIMANPTLQTAIHQITNPMNPSQSTLVYGGSVIGTVDTKTGMVYQGSLGSITNVQSALGKGWQIGTDNNGVQFLAPPGASASGTSHEGAVYTAAEALGGAGSGNGEAASSTGGMLGVSAGMPRTSLHGVAAPDTASPAPVMPASAGMNLTGAAGQTAPAGAGLSAVAAQGNTATPTTTQVPQTVTVPPPIAPAARGGINPALLGPMMQSDPEGLYGQVQNVPIATPQVQVNATGG
jgi:hypothetical protein